jgi:hypothetical protein
MKIFGSAWLGPIDIRRISIKKALAPALRAGLWRDRGYTLDSVVVKVLRVSGSCLFQISAEHRRLENSRVSKMVL